MTYYYVRGKDDIQLMAAFSMKIGQTELLEQMWKDGEGCVDVIMTHLLKAWSPEVDATEENLMRFFDWRILTMPSLTPRRTSMSWASLASPAR